MSRKRGRIVLVGVVGLQLNRADFYEKELTFQVSCSYGPGRYDPDYELAGHDYPLGFVRWTEQRNFEAILAMLASRRLDFARLITHQFEFGDAPQAYATIQNDSSALGVLLKYAADATDWSAPAARTVEVNPPKATGSASTPTIAVVGAGNFTRATMMPVLAKLPCRLKYVAGRSGTAALQHTATKFKVEKATTDLSAVLADAEVNLLMVTTNHDSHARLVSQGLQAGKHVFVEKPLAINADQLRQVEQAVIAHPNRQLMVGFNRRFSPHSQKCHALLKGRAAPLAINMLINAGEIPPEHWVHDPEVGGGRIIGEACHFIDLAVYLAGSPVRAVSAQRFGGASLVRDDKMTISLALADGSIASVNYFANGSKSFPKESITIFSDNRVLTIDNFRRTTGYGFKSFSKLKTFRQEKGHRQQFEQLLKRVQTGGEWLIPWSELENVALASFAAVKAARDEETIQV
jgi:predicted dehydrogenase